MAGKLAYFLLGFSTLVISQGVVEDYEMEQQQPYPQQHTYSLGQEVGSSLTVNCSRGWMVAKLLTAEAEHSEPKLITLETSQLLRGGRLKMGHTNNTNCLAHFVRNGTDGEMLWMLNVSYRECGIREHNTQLGINYTAEVIFSSPRISESLTYTLSCLVPHGELLLYQPYLQLSQLGRNIYAESNTTTAKIVRKSLLKTRIKTKEGAHNVHGIFSYPLNCWTAPEDSQDESQRLYLVKDGCPTFNSETNPYAAMYQTNTKVSFARYTMMFFIAYDELAANSKNSGAFRLTCDLFVCSGYQYKGVADLPQCPSVGFCEDGTPSQPRRFNTRNLSKSAFRKAEFPSLLSFYEGLVDPDYKPLESSIFKPPIYIPKTSDSSLSSTPTRLISQDWSYLYVIILSLMMVGMVFAVLLAIWNFSGSNGRNMIRQTLLKSAAERRAAAAREELLSRPLVREMLNLPELESGKIPTPGLRSNP